MSEIISYCAIALKSFDILLVSYFRKTKQPVNERKKGGGENELSGELFCFLLVVNYKLTIQILEKDYQQWWDAFSHEFFDDEAKMTFILTEDNNKPEKLS